MSATVHANPTSQSQPVSDGLPVPEKANKGVWTFGTLLLPILATFPFSIPLLQQFAQQSHRRYCLPFLAIVVLLLIFPAKKRSAGFTASRRIFTFVLLTTALVVFGFGVWFYQASFAMASICLAVMAWGFWGREETGWARMFGLSVLSASLIPMSFDIAVIDFFERVVGYCTACALDGLGIPVLRTGGTISTKSTDLATSWIIGRHASILFATSFSILLCVLRRHSFLIAVGSIVSGWLWWIVVMTLHLLTVILLREYADMMVEGSAIRLTLQILTAFVLVLVLWSNNSFLANFFAEIDREGQSDYAFPKSAEVFNAIALWPRTGTEEDADEIRAPSNLLAIGFGVLFALLSLPAAGLLLIDLTRPSTAPWAVENHALLPGQDAFPKEVRGWQLAAYAAQLPPDSSAFGLVSNQWTYQNADSSTMLVAMEFEPTFQRDYLLALENDGWEIISAKPADFEDDEWPASELVFRRVNSGEFMFLWLSYCDKDGVLPDNKSRNQSSAWTTVLDRFRADRTADAIGQIQIRNQVVFTDMPSPMEQAKLRSTVNSLRLLALNKSLAAVKRPL